MDIICPHCRHYNSGSVRGGSCIRCSELLFPESAATIVAIDPAVKDAEPVVLVVDTAGLVEVVANGDVEIVEVEKPHSSKKKAVIAAYLTFIDVPFDEDATKAELVELMKRTG